MLPIADCDSVGYTDYTQMLECFGHEWKWFAIVINYTSDS